MAEGHTGEGGRWNGTARLFEQRSGCCFDRYDRPSYSYSALGCVSAVFVDPRV